MHLGNVILSIWDLEIFSFNMVYDNICPVGWYQHIPWPTHYMDAELRQSLPYKLPGISHHCPVFYYCYLYASIDIGRDQREPKCFLGSFFMLLWTFYLLLLVSISSYWDHCMRQGHGSYIAYHFNEKLWGIYCVCCSQFNVSSLYLPIDADKTYR